MYQNLNQTGIELFLFYTLQWSDLNYLSHQTNKKLVRNNRSEMNGKLNCMEIQNKNARKRDMIVVGWFRDFEFWKLWRAGKRKGPLILSVNRKSSNPNCKRTHTHMQISTIFQRLHHHTISAFTLTRSEKSNHVAFLNFHIFITCDKYK